MLKNNTLIFLMLSLFFLIGCPVYQPLEDDYYEDTHEPVYMDWKTFRESIELQEPKNLLKVGKIYRQDPLLLINEPNQGIHIYDNSDPEFPINKGFLRIVGNVDMAMMGGVLYADSFTDLVVLEISEAGVKELRRQKDVFPYDPYQVLDSEEHVYGYANQANGVVIEWKKRENKNE